MKYIIGSRGSRLALIQTKYVQEKLVKAYPEHTFEIQIIKTKGDKIQNKLVEKVCLSKRLKKRSFLGKSIWEFTA